MKLSSIISESSFLMYRSDDDIKDVIQSNRIAQYTIETNRLFFDNSRFVDRGPIVVNGIEEVIGVLYEIEPDISEDKIARVRYGLERNGDTTGYSFNGKRGMYDISQTKKGLTSRGIHAINESSRGEVIRFAKLEEGDLRMQSKPVLLNSLNVRLPINDERIRHLTDYNFKGLTDGYTVRLAQIDDDYSPEFLLNFYIEDPSGTIIGQINLHKDPRGSQVSLRFDKKRGWLNSDEFLSKEEAVNWVVKHINAYTSEARSAYG